MTTLRAAIALAVLGLFQVPTASLAADFPTVVEEILRSQTEGLISELEEEAKSALIACVKKVLEGLPNGQKRYVVQGETFEERERRFGKVVQDNHAEWKQNIARGCASVALSGSRSSREIGSSGSR